MKKYEKLIKEMEDIKDFLDKYYMNIIYESCEKYDKKILKIINEIENLRETFEITEEELENAYNLEEYILDTTILGCVRKIG